MAFSLSKIEVETFLFPLEKILKDWRWHSSDMAYGSSVGFERLNVAKVVYMCLECMIVHDAFHGCYWMDTQGPKGSGRVL